MSVLVNSETRVLVQGITGRDGSFHAKQMLEYGTKVVAGVTPGKGGQKFEDKVPIFNTVADAVAATGAKCSVCPWWPVSVSTAAIRPIWCSKKRPASRLPASRSRAARSRRSGFGTGGIRAAGVPGRSE